MTITDFITLDDHAKAETINRATCLNNHYKDGYKISLCDLHDFIVEVIYSIQSNKILRFRFFSHDLKRDYIGQIDIRDYVAA